MKHAHQMALRTLAEYGSNAVPVDLHAICQRIGLEVEYSDNINMRLNSTDEISGALCYTDHYTAIINNAQHPNRKRFTLAHEMGHFVLNHGEKYDHATTLYRKDGGIITQHNADEIEANAFASELLMPEHSIYELIINQGIEDISVLAKRFLVSEQAMYYRLKRTGWL